MFRRSLQHEINQADAALLHQLPRLTELQIPCGLLRWAGAHELELVLPAALLELNCGSFSCETAQRLLKVCAALSQLRSLSLVMMHGGLVDCTPLRQLTHLTSLAIYSRQGVELRDLIEMTRALQRLRFTRGVQLEG